MLTGLVVCLLVLGLSSRHGSLRAETFVFQTDMYGDEEVPPVHTIAYGFVRFFFNDPRTAADYTVDVKGYSDTVVLGADIHRGARGVNGPVVRHLADGGFIVTSGRIRVSEEDLREMAAGSWYVSLKTTEYPEGALRGQISLPEGFLPEPAPEAMSDQSPDEATAASEGPATAVLVEAPAPALAPLPLPAVVVPPPAVPVFRPPNTGDAGLSRN